MKNIEEFFINKANDLSFVELKDSANYNIKGFDLDTNVPLPIIVYDLINEVKEKRAQEELKISSFINGMIYSLGTDKNFKYNERYKEILYRFNKNIEDYILVSSMKLIEENKLDDGLIFVRGLTNLNQDNKLGVFNYGLALERKAQEFYNKNKNKEGKMFLKESTKSFEKALDLDENFPPAYYKLGYHYLNSNQFTKSSLMWEKFLELSEDENLNGEVNTNLIKIKDNVDYEDGCNDIFMGNPEEGLKKLSPLKDKYEDWWNLLFMIGLALRQLGMYKEAIEEFEKVLIINPNQIDTFNELGLCLANMGSFDTAIEKFTEGINLKEDYEILCNRGMTYLQMGEIEKASLDIEKAYEMNPEDEITKICKNQIDLVKKN